MDSFLKWEQSLDKLETNERLEQIEIIKNLLKESHVNIDKHIKAEDAELKNVRQRLNHINNVNQSGKNTPSNSENPLKVALNTVFVEFRDKAAKELCALYPQSKEQKVATRTPQVVVNLLRQTGQAVMEFCAREASNQRKLMLKQVELRQEDIKEDPLGMFCEFQKTIKDFFTEIVVKKFQETETVDLFESFSKETNIKEDLKLKKSFSEFIKSLVEFCWTLSVEKNEYKLYWSMDDFDNDCKKKGIKTEEITVEKLFNYSQNADSAEYAYKPVLIEWTSKGFNVIGFGCYNTNKLNVKEAAKGSNADIPNMSRNQTPEPSEANTPDIPQKSTSDLPKAEFLELSKEKLTEDSKSGNQEVCPPTVSLSEV